jgi:hypothetical protein
MVILNKGYLKKENRIIDLQYVDIMNDCVWAYDRVADKAIKYNSKNVNVLYNSFFKDNSDIELFTDDVVEDSEGTQYMVVHTGTGWFLRNRLSKEDSPMSKFVFSDEKDKLRVSKIGNLNMKA